MALKVYRARSMQDALSEVKKDLGQDAVILHTRNYRSRGLLGLGAKTIVEITATTDENPRTRPSPDRPVRASTKPETTMRDRLLPSSDRAPDSRRPAHPGAAALLEGLMQQDGEQAPRSAMAARAYGMGSAPVVDESETAASLAVEKPVEVDQRPTSHAPGRPEPVTMRVAPSRQVKPAGAEPAVEDELRSIKRMVSKLLQSQGPAHAGPGVGGMSDPLFEHYLRLQENAVAAEIADEIIGRVRDELSLAELTDTEIVRETVLREIAGLLPVAPESPSRKRPVDDRPLTVALIGPTGVGKTTTVAKLAATSKLRMGRSVGLITTDTYRIAAVEQLRTYADIIGLPIKVVASPAEMRPALESMSELDEILIDTAGRSQHDEERLAELRAYLDEADPHETHLVLSSVAAESVMTRAVDNFGKLGPNRVIFTKLDEAVNTGVLLSVVRRIGVSLSFVTTGQEVPDHIEPGRADRLARMILTGRLPG